MENAPRSEPSHLAVLSNAEIADRLASLAQLLAAQKENPYKVKAYQRAAAKIRTFSESIDDLVREDADLTTFAGIGDAIAAVIREIVLTGTSGKLEKLRAGASAELADISQYPRLAYRANSQKRSAMIPTVRLAISALPLSLARWDRAHPEIPTLRSRWHRLTGWIPIVRREVSAGLFHSSASWAARAG